MSITAAVIAIIAVVHSCGPSLAQDAGASAPLPIAPQSARPVKKHIKPPVPERFAQTAPAATQPTHSAQLPNGASTITETYGDWTIACGIENGMKLCNLNQAQGNKETGQRTFAIELRTPKDGKTEGTILMPFGLKLDAGALLKLDDKDLGKGLRFSTCVPQGCLLPVSFPTVATDAMRKGKTLVVASLNLSNGQAVTFNVSLNGFASALDRVEQLGK
jgi:invasion protein IalB